MSDLADHAYLWDGSEPGWCLVLVDSDKSLGTAPFAIYNRKHAHALIIEDGEIYAQVIERMLAEGCPVVSPTGMSGPDPGDTSGTS